MEKLSTKAETVLSGIILIVVLTLFSKYYEPTTTVPVINVSPVISGSK